MDKKEIVSILSRCKYKKGWSLHVGSWEVEDSEHRCWIMVQVDGRCTETGKSIKWNGRKWNISEYATKSEVVLTAFLACLQAEEHEARENFRYRGQTILGPHIDVDAMAKFLADHGRTVLDERPKGGIIP